MQATSDMASGEAGRCHLEARQLASRAASLFPVIFQAKCDALVEQVDIDADVAFEGICVAVLDNLLPSLVADQAGVVGQAKQTLHWAAGFPILQATTESVMPP